MADGPIRELEKKLESGGKVDVRRLTGLLVGVKAIKDTLKVDIGLALTREPTALVNPMASAVFVADEADATNIVLCKMSEGEDKERLAKAYHETTGANKKNHFQGDPTMSVINTLYRNYDEFGNSTL